MSAFYRRSAIYAAFFAPSTDIRSSIDALVRKHLRQAPRRVIDPACGPGLWLEHFQRQGAEVAGCDLEESAIVGAAARLPKRGARVLVGDMRRPPDELGGEFDCAINLDNSIGHLNDPLDVVAHFASMRQRLSPRGIYVIGLAIREAKDTIPTGVVFERGRNSTVLRQYQRPRKSTRAREKKYIWERGGEERQGGGERGSACASEKERERTRQGGRDGGFSELA
jgi:SAM-dependent methyltransferase